jgi:hypothetical protein
VSGARERAHVWCGFIPGMKTENRLVVCAASVKHAINVLDCSGYRVSRGLFHKGFERTRDPKRLAVAVRYGAWLELIQGIEQTFTPLRLYPTPAEVHEAMQFKLGNKDPNSTYFNGNLADASP